MLVIKKFNNNLFWACPLSTKIKENNRYYLRIQTKEGDRSVIISQMRLRDTKRLGEKVGIIDIEHFKKIKTVIKELL